MRNRGFLFLLSAVTLIAIGAASCAAPAGDDDDDGFGSPAGTTSPVVSPTGTSTPQAITPRSSFVSGDGTQIWLCVETQFDGSMIAVHTEDGTTCEATDLGVGKASTADRPHYAAIRLDASGCGTGSHQWSIDYQVNDDRCTGGCVNQQMDFALDADDPFGSFCGFGTVPPIESLDSYIALTTQKLRFRADVGPFPSVSIAKLAIYDLADVSLAECTANAVITNGGTGLFDADCTPDPAGVLAEGNTYNALVSGDAGDYEYVGYVSFAHDAPP